MGKEAPEEVAPPPFFPSVSLAHALTVGAGISIPLLALVLSHAAGKLWADAHYLLATWALLLCGAVLFVSLPHLAWAISDITRSPPWPSWALAVAIDLTLVLCETITVGAPGVLSSWVVGTTMTGVIVASMTLNTWAFVNHPKEKREK